MRRVVSTIVARAAHGPGTAFIPHIQGTEIGFSRTCGTDGGSALRQSSSQQTPIIRQDSVTGHHDVCRRLHRLRSARVVVAVTSSQAVKSEQFAPLPHRPWRCQACSLCHSPKPQRLHISSAGWSSSFVPSRHTSNPSRCQLATDPGTKQECHPN